MDTYGDNRGASDAATYVVPVHAADSTARGHVAEVLASAFTTDPHAVGLLPGQDRRHPESALLKLFTLFVDEATTSGGHALLCLRRSDDHPLGAALWEGPGGVAPTRPLGNLVPYVRIFRHRLLEAARTHLEMHRWRPRSPHWYLWTLGTLPESRGHGVGTTLVRWGLDRADTEGCGAYLESSSRENVAYYAHFGFVEQRVIRTPGTTPVISMWREPRGTREPDRSQG